jgi:hypothetical protein
VGLQQWQQQGLQWVCFFQVRCHHLSVRCSIHGVSLQQWQQQGLQWVFFCQVRLLDYI